MFDDGSHPCQVQHRIHPLVQDTDDNDGIALDPVENEMSADRQAAVSGANVSPRDAGFG